MAKFGQQVTVELKMKVLEIYKSRIGIKQAKIAAMLNLPVQVVEAILDWKV